MGILLPPPFPDLRICLQIFLCTHLHRNLLLKLNVSVTYVLGSCIMDSVCLDKGETHIAPHVFSLNHRHLWPHT